MLHRMRFLELSRGQEELNKEGSVDRIDGLADQKSARTSDTR